MDKACSPGTGLGVDVAPLAPGTAVPSRDRTGARGIPLPILQPWPVTSAWSVGTKRGAGLTIFPLPRALYPGHPTGVPVPPARALLLTPPHP